MNDRPDDIIKPTKQRMRRAPGHDELTETQAGGVVRKSGAVRVWSQLENLYRNRRLTDEQYQAGQKYYADWYLSGFQPNVTSKLQEWIQNGGGGQGSMDAMERRVFHQKRFAQANALLDGLGTRKAVHWFVINDTPAEAIGRKFWGYAGKHSAAAGAVTGLQISLHQLAKFYGLVK
jgi:hypothetical protein